MYCMTFEVFELTMFYRGHPPIPFLEHLEAFEDQMTLMNLKCYVDYRAIPNLYRDLTFKITQTEVI